MSGVISQPIPAYQNLPIRADFYEPSQFFISAITVGQPDTIVTTSVNHNYVIGQEVRLLIPPSFGSRGLSGQTGIVIEIPSANQVTLNIVSVGVDAFIASTNTTQSAQIVAVGDINTGVTNANGRQMNGTYIPGSFVDISPA